MLSYGIFMVSCSYTILLFLVLLISYFTLKITFYFLYDSLSITDLDRILVILAFVSYYLTTCCYRFSSVCSRNLLIWWRGKWIRIISFFHFWGLNNSSEYIHICLLVMLLSTSYSPEYHKRKLFYSTLNTLP